jgi:hypothetical protein
MSATKSELAALFVTARGNDSPQANPHLYVVAPTKKPYPNG